MEFGQIVLLGLSVGFFVYLALFILIKQTEANRRKNDPNDHKE